ncbi:general transcription factor II-I repeat domain-containing protein 2 [Trichonephila clavipes]|nr:general transcription factor II-I repeat domain-containing protein 2 [Trichonephila clavipes]
MLGFPALDVFFSTRARFHVALEIAKRGKPFTDGEMIKECVISVTEEMRSEKWFSLALDESTDVSDTAQVLILIRGVNKNYEMYELLDVDNIHGETTGEDIFKGVDNAINKKNLREKT